MQTRISATTAEAIGAMAVTMGKTGALPRTEAAAAATILRQAAKPTKTGESTAKRRSGMLTTEQVADLLNCSRKTVLRMADAGQLTRRYLRPGNAKSLRFSEAEIEALCGTGTEGGETSK